MCHHAPLAESDMLGPYHLERKLGVGGMGQVYAARHRQTGRRFALKTLREAFARNAEVRSRFLREATALSRLSHPHVISVLDVSPPDSAVPYVVMQLLQGEDLRSRLDREGQLAPGRAARILAPIAEGLAHAHARGVVHRDLKPENIFLVQETGAPLVPKLLDFGISKLAGEPAMTRDTLLLGTPDYMSPEMVEGAAAAVDASDQYALGAILYEAVVGHRPFCHDRLYTLLTAILRGEFPRPREVVPSLPPYLEAIILTAMAPKPAQRFQDVSVMASALRHVAEHCAQDLPNEPRPQPADRHPTRAASPRALREIPRVPVAV